MRHFSLLVAVAALAIVSQSCVAQDSNTTVVADAPATSGTAGAAVVAPAPAVEEAATTETALPPPPPLVYAPTRSFGQWVRDLPHDPWVLVGFIFSLASGIGFLFIIYTVLFELVMGIPYKKQSFVLGGSPTQNPVAAVH